MSDEDKTHTQGEVDILVMLAEIRETTRNTNAELQEHKKDDDGHFGGLHAADEKTFDAVAKLPEKLATCSEKLKTEILGISRREFTNATEFKVFRTKVLVWTSAALFFGSIAGAALNYYLMFSK